MSSIIRKPLLDLGLGDQSETDQRRDEEPDGGGDCDVRPLIARDGPVEERGLGVVGVQPGLVVQEPILAGCQEPPQGGQHEGEDEVGHQRHRGAAEQDAQHGAGQQA